LVSILIDRECPPRFNICAKGYKIPRDGRGKEGQVRTISESELYIDYGFFGGLAAMSELRELLDELYESLD
jgi:hypothetical protein